MGAPALSVTTFCARNRAQQAAPLPNQILRSALMLPRECKDHAGASLRQRSCVVFVLPPRPLRETAVAGSISVEGLDAEAVLLVLLGHADEVAQPLLELLRAVAGGVQEGDADALVG